MFFELRHTILLFNFKILCERFYPNEVKTAKAKLLEQNSVSTCPQCICIMNYLEWRITVRIDRRIATSRITQIDTYEYITYENLTSRAYCGIW